MKYIALDFETGNASPLSACALGVSIFEDDALVREQVSLILPPAGVRKFHWGNVRVNHITEKMVADAPSFDEVWRPLAEEAEGSVLVCHNAMFDTAVLCACLAHYHLPMPPAAMCARSRSPAACGRSLPTTSWIRSRMRSASRSTTTRPVGRPRRRPDSAGRPARDRQRGRGRAGGKDRHAAGPHLPDGHDAVQHRKGSKGRESVCSSL